MSSPSPVEIFVPLVAFGVLGFLAFGVVGSALGVVLGAGFGAIASVPDDDGEVKERPR